MRKNVFAFETDERAYSAPPESQNLELDVLVTGQTGERKEREKMGREEERGRKGTEGRGGVGGWRDKLGCFLTLRGMDVPDFKHVNSKKNTCIWLKMSALLF